MTGFNTQEGGGEYRLQFETDNREHYELMQKTARQCVGTGKPLTNADCIRGMSDEELAEEIMCPYDMEAGMCTNPSDCLSCCLEWLRQPVQPTPDAPDTHEHSGLLEE